MTRRFQPGLVPTIAAIVAVALLVSLGLWQLRRYAWRQQWLNERNARIDLPAVPIAEALADPASFGERRAVARGRLLLSETIVVSPIQRGLDSGIEVLTPLSLVSPASPDAPLLLVDRGFVPGMRAGSFLQEDASREPTEVEVTGLLFPLAIQDVVPRSVTEPRREWQRFDPSRGDGVALLQGQLSRPLAPLLLQAADGAPDALPVGGFARPTSPVDHISYALTWFGMALAAAATWVGLGFHTAREKERAANREASRARLAVHSGGEIKGDGG
jgi:surfeit locus 1 family protein